MNVASSEAVTQMMNFGPEGTTNELFFIRELFILILCVRVFFFSCMYVWAPYVCLLFKEANIEGGYQMPWDWNSDDCDPP